MEPAPLTLRHKPFHCSAKHVPEDKKPHCRSTDMLLSVVNDISFCRYRWLGILDAMMLSPYLLINDNFIDYI